MTTLLGKADEASTSDGPTGTSAADVQALKDKINDLGAKVKEAKAVSGTVGSVAGPLYALLGFM